jgi:uncharacterized protein
MTILIDTTYLYALYYVGDSKHQAAEQFAQQLKSRVIVPAVVLPEVAFLFLRDTGYFGLQRFIEEFTTTDTPLESLLTSDLQRINQIMRDYQGAKLDLVDCCIMAIAERLNITQVCTFDRRDFSIFRPKHCDYLELLP